MSNPELLSRIYDAIYEEEDARACRDIDDSACVVVPGNFFKLAVTLALTKLGDALINPKTTLPWLLGAMQAPPWIAAVLVPIRESGSMLPQLIIAHYMRRMERRKWAWVAGSVVQALAVFGLAYAAFRLAGLAGGLTILALVVVFSLARGFCSVALKDVLGKTVPKERRGQATGLAASIAGLGVVCFALWLWQRSSEDPPYGWLLLGGGLLWLVASMVFASIRERSGATSGGRSGIGEALQSFTILSSDQDFRRFVIVRALMVGSALMAPFLVMLTEQNTPVALALFLLAQGAAALLSGSFWGRFADYSSRRVIIGSASAAATLGLTVVLAGMLSEPLLQSSWFLPAAFFVLAIIHNGVRAGRKTYVVDLGSDDQRTSYVAVSNTVIGVLLLVAAAVSAAASQWSPLTALGVFAVFAGVAALLALRLPEVQALASDGR